MGSTKLLSVLTIFGIAGSHLAHGDLNPKPNDLFGMQMAVKAFGSVCWWEYAKRFPKTNSPRFNDCNGQLQAQLEQITGPSSPFPPGMEDMMPQYFGQWTNEQHMNQIPEEYTEKCSSTLDDPATKPKYSEGEALNDGNNGTYPFQAFAYCMLHTLRGRHGDVAIEEVKREFTHDKKDWRQTLLDRQNEFRGRHGVKAFKILPVLNDAAQKWAEKLAQDCSSKHNEGATPDYYYKGKASGENLNEGESKEAAEITALSTANSWYEEIKSYPFPMGYNGQNGDWQSFGHFTQTVWKGSKYVGYGRATNDACRDQGRATAYIVARFWPSGNSNNAWKENVLPVQANN